MCIWRGLPLYESLREQVVEDGRDDKPEGAFIHREAIEVVENEPIPEDLAALAVMVD
jgi:hypothetical protein